MPGLPAVLMDTSQPIHPRIPSIPNKPLNFESGPALPMSSSARWIVSLALLAILAGCTGPERAGRRTRVERSPMPRRLTAPEPTLPRLQAERSVLPSLRGMRVVIDAGHGGKDPGTRGVSRMPEKSIVLLIANEVGRLLTHRGASVISTRTDDRFLELDDRAAFAGRHRCHLFVSVHADSAPRSSASGSTLYIARGASSDSFAAARSIQHALKDAGIECRGIQRANFRVLAAHPYPAVLVECGFLTNAGDANRLNSQQYRSKVAAAVARGIADHLSR